MIRLLFAAILALAAPSHAFAQALTAPLPNGDNLIGRVITRPVNNAGTIAGCTVGTSSAQCLAAATATQHVGLQNTSNTAIIACSWSGAAALNAAGSFMLQPGQGRDYGPGIGWVPTGALFCISTQASVSLYVELN